MDDLSLKEKFSQLQDEQHKRLARMKAKQAKLKNEEIKKDFSFGVGDDLKLTTSDVSTSSIVGLNVSLENANTSMREELRELQDETGRLRKSLAEREYEIKRLHKKMEKTEEEKRLLSGVGIAGDSASMKIVELSKKNRELTSQMESEKSKCMRLQQKIIELERKIAYESIGNISLGSNISQSSLHQRYPPESSRVTVEELKEQISSANLKATEYRNQVQSLKQELKIAFKVLSQETGENQSSLQALLANGGQGFRGRAQQVLSLQNKVKDLEQKLKSDVNLTPTVDKNISRIKAMEKTRKEQNDALKDDVSKLQEQISDLNRKLEASKARNKVLSSEMKSQKSQISMLADKGTHDNELISTLMRQQENLQKMLERSSVMNDSATRKEIIINKELNDQKQRESSEITRLKQLLAERDARLRELEEQQVDASDSLDEEDKKPLSVVRSPKTVQHQASASVPSRILNTASPTSGADPKELQSKCVELKALYEASEAERQHLVKLVSVLNVRIEDSAKKTAECIAEIHEEKKKCALLEQQVETLKATQKSDGNFTNRQVNVGVDNSKELQAQLLIQQDENNALKEALDSTLRNKRNDVAMYEDMTQQTKQVFLDALRSFSSKQ